MADNHADLRERAENRCELCGNDDGLEPVDVPPTDGQTLERAILACAACRDGSQDPAGNAAHWNCLREAAWSGVPAVQVASWRLLSRLEGSAWARELLGQIYLDEETLEWAREGLDSAGDEEDDDAPPTLDSNGTALADGDSVTIIKDLDAKGAGFVAKRGTIVKSIRLTGDPENIEGRVNKTVLVLKTRFLKKV